MTTFIGRLDNLVHRFGMTVCIVHHSGHGTNARARGSSVLQASLDYEYKVDRTDSNNTMYVTFEQSLNKDGMGMETMNYEFREIELFGFDDLTSGFLVTTDVVPKAAKASAANDATLAAIKAYQLDKNRQHPIEVWVNAADLVGILKKDDGSDVPRKTINSRLVALKEKDLVHYDEAKGYQVKDFDHDVF